MDTVEVGGLRIAYERAGVGPALVLLHGFVGDGPSTWRRQVDDLCGEFAVVAQRLDQCLRAADLAADEFVELMVPTMFSGATRSTQVDAFSTSVGEFHPGGFRTMANALAEADLRDVLPRVTVPTLLLYGDADVRAPTSVAEHFHKAIAGSELVVLPGVGHVSSVEAPNLVTSKLRAFLRSLPG